RTDKLSAARTPSRADCGSRPSAPMRSRSGAICRARGCSGICPAPPPRLGYGWRKRGHHGNQSHSDCKPAHACTHFDPPAYADWYKPITPFSTACRPAGCDGRHRSVDLNLGAPRNLPRELGVQIISWSDGFFRNANCEGRRYLGFIFERGDGGRRDPPGLSKWPPSLGVTQRQITTWPTVEGETRKAGRLLQVA